MWLAIFRFITQLLYVITHLNEYLLNEQTCTMQTIFQSIMPKQIGDCNNVFTTVYHTVECNTNEIYQCNTSAKIIQNFVRETKLLFGLSHDCTVTLIFQNPKELWRGIPRYPDRYLNICPYSVHKSDAVNAGCNLILNVQWSLLLTSVTTSVLISTPVNLQAWISLKQKYNHSKM